MSERNATVGIDKWIEFQICTDLGDIISDRVDVRLIQDCLGQRHLSATAVCTALARGKLRALRVR